MAQVDRFEFPADRWYEPREHLWLLPRRDGEDWLVTVGLDALGQEALGEMVYVQLVDPGRPVSRGEALGSMEAEKMVRPLLAPAAGTLVAVNPAVMTTPRLVNADPYGAGWLVRLRVVGWPPAGAPLLHGDPAVTAWIRAELDAEELRP